MQWSLKSNAKHGKSTGHSIETHWLKKKIPFFLGPLHVYKVQEAGQKILLIRNGSIALAPFLSPLHLFLPQIFLDQHARPLSAFVLYHFQWNLSRRSKKRRFEIYTLLVCASSFNLRFKFLKPICTPYIPFFFLLIWYKNSDIEY